MDDVVNLHIHGAGVRKGLRDMCSSQPVKIREWRTEQIHPKERHHGVRLHRVYGLPGKYPVMPKCALSTLIAISTLNHALELIMSTTANNVSNESDHQIQGTHKQVSDSRLRPKTHQCPAAAPNLDNSSHSHCLHR